ncbi:unnamed protein product [Paramecium octaurelia]|uniref:Uncharacterized protein n=1 Tax=Paramecium octaurelia TaxID=43137 RepID=A0A8S1XG70_PAROT|nr:unnamed protein product [Paramecium octaurelia]
MIRKNSEILILCEYNFLVRKRIKMNMVRRIQWEQ